MKTERTIVQGEPVDIQGSHIINIRSAKLSSHFMPVGKSFVKGVDALLSILVVESVKINFCPFRSFSANRVELVDLKRAHASKVHVEPLEL